MAESRDIYDAFTFYNELDLLELRLNTLDDVADYFVLVEGKKTYQGDDKPLHYWENRERFEEFEERIIHVVVDDYPDNVESAWDREFHTRNSIEDGLSDCEPDDVVIVSDVDEIPRPDIVERRVGTRGISILGLRLFYYFFNGLITDRLFPGPAICEYKDMTTPQDTRDIAMNYVNLDMAIPMDFENYPFRLQSAACSLWASLRQRDLVRVIPNAGWHFSFLSDVEGIIDKIETYSHTELNRAEYKDPDRIREKITSGEDIFDRGYELEFVDIDRSFPEYLLQNRSNFEQYIFEPQ